METQLGNVFVGRGSVGELFKRNNNLQRRCAALLVGVLVLLYLSHVLEELQQILMLGWGYGRLDLGVTHCGLKL